MASPLQPGRRLDPGETVLVPPVNGGSAHVATLGAVLGHRGRSGYVYSATLGSETVAVKVFHRTGTESALPPMDHLRELYEVFYGDTSRNLPAAAPPSALALDPQTGDPIGIVMPFYDTAGGEYYSIADFEQTTAKENPEFAKKLALRVLNDVLAVHYLDLVIGDISDANILVHTAPSIVWLDVDSWGTKVRDPGLTSEGYTLPARLRDDSTNQFRTADRFAAAVLAAQFLSLSMMHPFGPEKHGSVSVTIQHRVDAGELWFVKPQLFAVRAGQPKYPPLLAAALATTLAEPSDKNFRQLIAAIANLKIEDPCATCSGRHFVGGCPTDDDDDTRVTTPPVRQRSGQGKVPAASVTPSGPSNMTTSPSKGTPRRLPLHRRVARVVGVAIASVMVLYLLLTAIAWTVWSEKSLAEIGACFSLDEVKHDLPSSSCGSSAAVLRLDRVNFAVLPALPIIGNLLFPDNWVTEACGPQYSYGRVSGWFAVQCFSKIK